jgi:hypothetical protein
MIGTLVPERGGVDSDASSGEDQLPRATYQMLQETDEA